MKYYQASVLIMQITVISWFPTLKNVRLCSIDYENIDNYIQI